MGSVGRSEVLKLYKSMLRESQKFSSYNFKNFAIRKVRDSFKDSKSLKDQQEISAQVAKARTNLDIIKRQVIVGNMYESSKLIIEQRV